MSKPEDAVGTGEAEGQLTRSYTGKEGGQTARMREVPRVHDHCADSSKQGEVGNCEFSIEQPSGVVGSKMCS
jgi:hypothetical protein